MTEEEVTKLYNRYFKRFAGVKVWLDSQIAFGEEHGYVKTMFGFKREIAVFGDEDRSTFWKNQCVNSPIQGTAHQLLLIALAITDIKKKTYNLLQRPAMEGHDALVGYTALKLLPEVYKQGKKLLEDYTGQPVEEFVEMWCQKNQEFEKQLREQMKEAA
jgi:DNA polymerase I-like protein with 3'-5' exonuclease and polymerase domains